MKGIKKQVEDHFRDMQVWFKMFIEEGKGRVWIAGEEKIVSITKILHTEQTIWSKKFGLTGILDASVQVQVSNILPNMSKNSVKEMTNHIVPLEFKTGYPSQLSHCAQVIMYCLMLSERYGSNHFFGKKFTFD